VRCQVDSGKLDEVLRQLASAGVQSLVSQPPTLEELFLRHYAADGADPLEVPGAAGPEAGSAEPPVPAAGA
jgi:ABC-2 type transport system ATP-binding protein